ncbi:uncharacterized protein L201_005942 [Kwoniella dendrophila CBS 6074]|uniref:Uncharacterized protein n=1 Tax=Kwoniella dendrophila CBS 6074 TaxID=1295534 RepID=A0AAX4K2N4_9TREE
MSPTNDQTSYSNNVESGPSTSTHRISAARSHSSPSLTHWIGNSNGQMKRSWNPSSSPCIPIISIDEDKKGIGRLNKGKGKGKGKELDLEDGLSQLYVTHEKNQASSSSSAAAAAAEYKRRSLSPIKKTLALPQPTSSDISVSSSQTSTNISRQPSDSEMQSQPQPQESSKRKSWSSSVLGSAVSAGVFGAALGLTAYRLISNQPSSAIPNQQLAAEEILNQDGTNLTDQDRDVQSEDREESNQPQQDERTIQERIMPSENSIIDDTDLAITDNSLNMKEDEIPHITASSDIQDIQIKNPIINDLPPPPAYEETMKSAASQNRETKEWEDITEYLITPSSTRVSTIRSKVSYSNISPSPCSKQKRKRNHQIRRTRSSRNGLLMFNQHPLSNSRSLPSIEIHNIDDYDIHSDVETPINKHSPVPIVDGYPNMCEEGNEGEQDQDHVNDEHTNEMISRLDSMSLQLTTLIEQGRKALETTPGLGTTPGWEDEIQHGDGKDLFSPSNSRVDDKSNDNNTNIVADVEAKTEKNIRRKSQIPMKAGSSLNSNKHPTTRLTSSSTLNDHHSSPLPSSSRLKLNDKHRKVGSSNDVESKHHVVRARSISKIPVRNKSMISGLNKL